MQRGRTLDNKTYVSYFLLQVRTPSMSDHYWLSSMTLKVVSFLPTPFRFPVLGFFKYSIARSFTPFTPRTCSLKASFRCCVGSRPLFLNHQSTYPGEGVLGRKCTICSVSKSGRALHAPSSSSVAERAIPTTSGGISVSVDRESCWRG